MKQYRIAVIDDDPFVVMHLRNTFAKRLAGVEVVGVSTPIAPAGVDVYVVDKDFEGDSLGFDVVCRIQEIAPDSLVVAYSAFLDREFLRLLLSEQCAGAFDKGSLEELEEMIELIGTFIGDRATGNRSSRGFRYTVRSISNLLHEWNLRLESSRRVSTEARKYD